MRHAFVMYQGKSVPYKGFRAFVYSPEYPSKVVESWDEFELLIKSGDWFSTEDEAMLKSVELELIREEENKKSRKKKDK